MAQVAVSFVLLIGAGLMLRSLLRLQSVDPGIRTDSVLSMRVALNFTKYKTPALRAQFARDLADRLRNLPGVRSAGGAGTFPMNEGGGFFAGVRIQGQPEVEQARLPRAEVHAATPGYFQTVGIPLLRGRLIEETDIADRQAVAVISDSMARQFFTDARSNRRADVHEQRPAVGHDRWRRGRRAKHAGVSAVDGVLSSGRAGAAADGHVSGANVRRSRCAHPADARGRPRARSATSLWISSARSMRCDRASLAAPRLTASLIGVFAAIALLITATGLAGVIAFSVNQRSQEFGVRMALGASRGSVLQMVLLQGLKLVAIGLVLGGLAAIALGSSVRTLLFDTEPTDVATYLGVAIVLGIVALVACLMPARRASSVDPLVALRNN